MFIIAKKSIFEELLTELNNTPMQNLIVNKDQNDAKKVIIIGATSGIGFALAKHYIKLDYLVGITGRRLKKLKNFQQQYLGKVFIKQMDVSRTTEAIIQLQHLLTQMNGVDIVIVNAGINLPNKRLHWPKELETIQTNVCGFSAIACSTLKYFIQRKQGHLVSISSISALKGDDIAPTYAASKAFISNYISGLRKKICKLKLPIVITDIKPGFVDTDMIKDSQSFWVTPVDKAATQIIKAINQKKHHAYISKRWRLIAWSMKLMPDWIYNKI